ncbi:MAG TPA: SHOCT domain-containing protein [Aggregatilineaceae bacterium]|nr:SHOCT domain-containing protein [Aggregatilineaceae bacterium]
MAAIGGLRLLAGLAFMGVIAGICIWLLTKLFPQAAVHQALPNGVDHERRATGETLVEVLDQRYARGEISKADYDRMRQDLEKRQAELPARR